MHAVARNHCFWLIGLMLITAGMAANIPKSIYLSFLGDEVVDYPAIRLNIGRPEQTVKLRVVFTANVCPLCEAGVTIALFDATKTLKHRSRTYETIVPSVVGRDIVNMAGLHSRMLIGFVDPNPSDLVDGIEGYFFVMHGAPWSSATVDRHGMRLAFAYGANFHWKSSMTILEGRGGHQNRLQTSEDADGILKQLALGTKHVPLEYIPPGVPTAVDILVAHINGNNAAALASTVASRVYSDRSNNYTILVAPDLDASFVPLALFQRYFGDKSFYTSTEAHADPRSWEPFVIALRIPTTTQNSTRATTVTTRKLVIEGRSVLPLLEGTNAVDFGRLEQSALAVSGSDKIKLLPHNIDNKTIVLGGHALWASAFLHLTFARDVNHHGTQVETVLLVPHHTASTFTVFQAILILALGLTYVRWKLSRQLFDSFIEKGHAIRHGFVVIIESDSLLWPILIPLWLAPVVVIWRSHELSQQPATLIQESQVFHVLVTGLVVWVGALLLVAIFDVLNIIRAFKASWNEFSTQVLASPWQWFTRTYVQDDTPPAMKPNPVKKTTEGKGVDGDDEHLDPHGLLSPWRKLFESNLAAYLLRDVLVDTLLGVTVWVFFITLESRVFALPVLFIMLSVVVYNNLYHFFILYFTIVWPIVAAHRRAGRAMKRVQPRSVDVLILVAIGLLVINNIVIVVNTTLFPLVENFSSVYGAGDSTAFIVMALFIMTLLFTAVLMSDRSIQTQTIRGSVIPPNLVPLDVVRQADNEDAAQRNFYREYQLDSHGKILPRHLLPLSHNGGADNSNNVVANRALFSGQFDAIDQQYHEAQATVHSAVLFRALDGLLSDQQ